MRFKPIALVLLTVASVGTVSTMAQDSDIPPRATVKPIPYEGPEWTEPALFAYMPQWQTQSSDAVVTVARLYPNLSTAVALSDLDGDGIGEMIVRFAEQCIPDTIDNDRPTCAHAVLGWNGDDWQVLLSRYASSVFEVRSAKGDVGFAFDGVAFSVSSLTVSLMSPSLVRWGNPIDDEGIIQVRQTMGAPESTNSGELYVAKVLVPGRQPAFLFARSVAPFYQWKLTDAKFQPIATGRSDGLPAAVALPGGDVELVAAEAGRFNSSRIALPVATNSVFSLIDDIEASVP